MAIKRIMIEETNSWQRPVLAVANSGTATKGNRYIVGSAPTGNFAALSANQIAWYDGAAWQADTPTEGWKVYNKDDNKTYLFDGSAWAEEAGADVSGKADKVTGATSGNLAGLDSNGNLTDSGVKAADFETAGAVGTHESTYDHSHIATAYNARGQYDTDLGCILMDL